jgi:hypothetical protein
MNRVYKHTIVVTVLSSHESTEDTFGSEWSLSDVHDTITSGDSIGSVHHQSTTKIDCSEIRSELLAIGNDGSFFDDLDTLDDLGDADRDYTHPKFNDD